MKKLMLGAGIASTVAIGSIVFTGGDIIDQVNTKVGGMFDMLNKYESNEGALAQKIIDLKTEKSNLQDQITLLNDSNINKDNQISELNLQIEDLNKQIAILEQQLGNQGGLAAEITRLEGEVNKANSKVGELQSILDRQINDGPMSDKEIGDLVSNIIVKDTIYLTPEIVDGMEVNLSTYAKATITKGLAAEGHTLYNIKIESLTDDSFRVVEGNDKGSFSWMCHKEEPVTYVINPFNDSYKNNYLIINDEFKYNIVASK